MTAPLPTAFIQGQGTVSADNLNTFVQTVTNVPLLRTVIGLPGMQILLEGFTTPGDGGAGPFYWNTTSIGPDNGTTIIVPQPGVPGAWIRLVISQTSIVTISNVASVAAFDGGASVPVIYISGYSTINDGGEGIFVYDAAASSTPANGGTILIDAAGNRYVRETNGGPYSVAWFGADSTGAADSTTAIQNTINANSWVSFPQGIFKISSALTTAFSGQRITGAGFFGYSVPPEGGTTINQTSTTANIFTVATESCTISDLQLVYVSTATNGSAFYVSESNTVLERFWIQGGYNGITFITNSGQFASHFQIFDTVFSGITCQNINDVYLSDFIINAGNTTNCSAACLYLLDFCQAVTVINADIIYGAAGFNCIYNAGLGQNTSPAYCKFTNVYFDSSAQGAVIDQCMGMTFTNCWFSNRPGNGAVVGFTATQGITFIGCLFANCAQNGCLVQVNAVGTNFIGCIFAGNSESSSGVYSGLDIAANTQNFSVIGCISKGNYLGFSATQLYGILINVGTSNNFVITGNDVTGNGTAGISDGSSGTIKVIHSNIGYNSPGSAFVITVGSSPFTYTNNSGTPQLVCVENGTVSSITIFGATVYTSTNVAFVLPTNQSTVVTYSSLPNMTWGPVV